MTGLPRPEELILNLEKHLRDERHVTLQLSEVDPSLAALQPIDGFRSARRLLVRMASDLQAAIADVSSTIEQIRNYEEIVRFTEVGWAGRRDEIAEACDADPKLGLTYWLEDWFIAMAAVRFDACERLLSMHELLPSGAQMLLRRCEATTRAVETRNWDVAAPLLAAGGRGIDIGDRTVPPRNTRHDLFVLLTRLALAADRRTEARSVLDEAHLLTNSPVIDALEARLSILESDAPQASVELIINPSPDAMFEIARFLNTTRNEKTFDLAIDAGMTAARNAIEAVRSLEEATAHIQRMLEPLPAEIHLALAERAVAEGDANLARSSLEQATADASSDVVRAEAHDKLADLAAHDGDYSRERSNRRAATDAWDRVPRPDRALVSAERLLALDPRDPEARCQLGSSLVQMTFGAERANALHNARRALDAINPIDGLVRSNLDQLYDRPWLRAWAYWVESYAHACLGQYGEADHKWLALLAALRGVVLQAENSAYWLCLADAAYDLDLWTLAELVARRAALLDPSRDSVREHIRALLNLGQHAQAVTVLGVPTNSYEWNMKAYALVYSGKHKEALALFKEHPPDADFDWAILAYVMELFIDGQKAEAVVIAEHFANRIRARYTVEARERLVRLSLILGDHDRIEKLTKETRSSGKHSNDFELAVVRASEGRIEEAAALLKAYVGSFQTLNDLAAWQHVDLVLMRIVLTDLDVPIPDLSQVQQELERIQAKLLAGQAPLAELDLAAAGIPGAATVSNSKRLASVVVALAEDDVEAAADILADSDNALAGSKEVAQQWISKQQKQMQDEAVLSTAVRDPDEVGRETETPVDQLESLVRPLTMGLPSSWFEGLPDPTIEHALFTQYLPILRITSKKPVPSLSVTADSELEPNRYYITVRGQLVEEGSLPVGRRLLPDGASALLPIEILHEAQDEKEPLLLRFGSLTIAEVEESKARLARLLSASAPEVAALRLGEVVVEHEAQLGDVPA